MFSFLLPSCVQEKAHLFSIDDMQVQVPLSLSTLPSNTDSSSSTGESLLLPTSSHGPFSWEQRCKSLMETEMAELVPSPSKCPHHSAEPNSSPLESTQGSNYPNWSADLYFGLPLYSPSPTPSSECQNQHPSSSNLCLSRTMVILPFQGRFSLPPRNLHNSTLQTHRSSQILSCQSINYALWSPLPVLFVPTMTTGLTLNPTHLLTGRQSFSPFLT